MAKRIVYDHNHDGIDRRGFLECMAWAGTGVFWSVSGDVLSSRAMGQKLKNAKGELHFVHISDSHMGFNRPANPDVAATLQVAIDRINALPQAPEFLIHTGDLTHSSKRSQSRKSFGTKRRWTNGSPTQRNWSRIMTWPFESRTAKSVARLSSF